MIVNKAPKTAEVKELVFVKIFAKGYWGLVPVSFFGGRSSEGTFKAPVAYLEPSQTSTMELSCEDGYRLKALNYF